MHYVFLGNFFYDEALRYVEEVTSEVSEKSLQALLLLIVYCLFYPQKGDIWKLLDFACRQSVELGYHREESGIAIIDTRQRVLRRTCFWNLYTIERIVGQLFGRTSDLPEPIITAEYPEHGISYGATPQEVMVQLTSATHHNRLVYLRSEIYRHMYLPTNPPSDGLDWFEGQFHTLLQWHRDLGLENQPAGVCTVTCTVAYHATIIFLFQPLVLRALSVRESSKADPRKITMMPSNNYHSACQLIATYEVVLQSLEDSPLGAYPMTFMSAHYIYLAGLTLMAHLFMAIDGSFKTLPPWGIDQDAALSGDIDFSGIFKSSGSCLILLAWCSERWRGMSGMLDTYKRLSENLLQMISMT